MTTDLNEYRTAKEKWLRASMRVTNAIAYCQRVLDGEDIDVDLDEEMGRAAEELRVAWDELDKLGITVHRD